MSLLHPALLGLLALAAVPVILHFLMRPKPKRLLFPALRLIEARRKTHVRRLRLRHVWLLLLRIAVIALLVVAVARPLVPAANYGLTTGETLTLLSVAAICAGIYAALVRWWSRQTATRHEFLYRRTLLRAGTGAAAALLLLLLVCWPYARRVSAEVADPSRVVAEDRPVAAVFLFDTSRSMDYQFEGAPRLEQAKKVALAHLASLPSGSRVAVVDSASSAPAIFQADLPGAKERIESIETRSLHVPLDDRVRATFDLHAQDRSQGLDDQSAVPEELRRDPFVRAVYVFTDLAGSAWSAATSSKLRERLDAEKWLQLYLVDVGVKEPINVGLTAVRPSEEVTTAGSRVMLRADVTAAGATGADAAVELYVDGGGGPVKQGQASIKVEPGQVGRVNFQLPNVAPPFVRGELRLVRGDPLAADDIRFFTVAVEPSPKILIVSDRADDAFLWTKALEARRYAVTRKGTAQLAGEALDQYHAVYLLNAAAPPKGVWPKLEAYIRGGGGVGVILGAPVDSSVYNSEPARAILPAALETQIAFRPPQALDPTDDGHPVFARFEEFGGYGRLITTEVSRHYVVTPADGAAVIAAFTYPRETRPAVVVRPVGEGRVLMIATGVDNTRTWSRLGYADNRYLIFADQVTRFLAGRSAGRRNFATGDSAVIDLGRGKPPEQLLLRSPGLRQRPIDPPKGGRRLVVPDLAEVRQYELAAPPNAPKFEGGFSVNLPPGESDFSRLTSDDLDARFGKDRYSVATTPENLAVAVRDTTLGAELMPYVLVLLVAVFCGEHLVANRFYDAEQAPDHK